MAFTRRHEALVHRSAHRAGNMIQELRPFEGQLDVAQHSGGPRGPRSEYRLPELFPGTFTLGTASDLADIVRLILG